MTQREKLPNACQEASNKAHVLSSLSFGYSLVTKTLSLFSMRSWDRFVPESDFRKSARDATTSLRVVNIF